MANEEPVIESEIWPAHYADGAERSIFTNDQSNIRYQAGTLNISNYGNLDRRKVQNGRKCA